jgi:hypothetical protein
MDMDYHSRNLREIAMESSNTENGDAAIQRVFDEMRIPAENRPAATSDLLELIERYEERSQFGSPRDADERFRRISKLCDKILEEFDRFPPIYKFIYDDAIYELAKLASSARAKLPPHRPHGFTNIHLADLITALYKLQKEHGGRPPLPLTNNIKLGEASGPLPEVLKILHGFVPTIAPLRSNYATLYRMRRRALDRIGIRPKRQR